MKDLIFYVVDDDLIFHFVVKKSLKFLDGNMNIKSFMNGKEAIEQLKSITDPNEIPDILFLDINMPVMDGWDFLEAFKNIKSKIDKKIAIYIVSSSCNPADILKAKEFNRLSGYLSKPVDVHKLELILKNQPCNLWPILYAS